jgi:cytoskeletal protein RodZ
MAVMSPCPPASPKLAALACVGAALALAGCGSSTKTVSENGPPPAGAQSSAASTQTTQSTTAATTTTATTPASTTPASTAGGTAAPTSTRTAAAPAFTHEESGGEGLSQAVATVQAHGYTPKDTSQYHSGQALRVLVGSREGTSGGYDQQAFFFLDGRYIGTDTKEPSASVEVVSQGDTEVVLAYPLYRRGDPASSPGGGRATVTFALDDGKLTPLQAIPPVQPGASPGRL